MVGQEHPEFASIETFLNARIAFVASSSDGVEDEVHPLSLAGGAPRRCQARLRKVFDAYWPALCCDKLT